MIDYDTLNEGDFVVILTDIIPYIGIYKKFGKFYDLNMNEIPSWIIKQVISISKIEGWMNND